MMGQVSARATTGSLLISSTTSSHPSRQADEGPGKPDVYLLTIADQIAGLAVVSAEPKEFTVVNIVGPINLEKLSELEGSFGVPLLNLPSKPKTSK